MAENGIIRKLYNWVIHWAYTPYGFIALFFLALAESSFFPIPPDVLLIALALGAPVKSFRFAALCTLGSVLGQEMYRKHDVWFVGLAGFTPIPYKVFTIAAGTFKMDFLRFVIVSAVSRGARFFIVSTLLWRYGQRIRVFIDKYFNLLSILFVIILLAGFIVIKMLFS